jgi:hypothetical protein
MPSPPCTQGRFGRGLPADEQTFVVISDSVMKQLDGLKTVPECRKAIRRFFKVGVMRERCMSDA